MTFRKKKLIIRPKLRIAVAMWYDENIKDFADIAKQINQKYCDLHGYDLIYSDHRFFTDRHPSWESIPMILDILTNNKYNNKYDYIMWIDADACFNFKSTNSLENIINNNKDKDIIYSGDRILFLINTGVGIFKTCPYCIDLCKEIISNKSRECIYYNDPLWEQNCVIHLHKNNLNHIQDKSIILPYGIIQIFPQLHNYNCENALILHYSGASNELRINELTKNLNSI